ncbi:protein ripply1 isoform X2 [Sagmatias obliquidens]|uniref:protein ripply1 isoform X2 n=1 Tax=Sagmatias obliquidens TaxID=3371155 RepID=UPI000F4413FE|nr:protein ripply1 isoform X2 [Lagenorhynchus obliquidens]
MDPAARAPAPALAPASAPALAQGPLALPGLGNPSPLLSSRQEVDRSERLFWPKSRSFDYLYSDGEILLQNFPVQATINLYEDSASEEEEDKEEEEEADEKGPEGCVKAPGPAPHRASAPSPSLLLTCPN